MKADPRFLRQPKEFWAHVRTIGEKVGYTQRGKKAIKVPTLVEIRRAFKKLSLSIDHIAPNAETLTPFGESLMAYFAFRAEVLNATVQGQLMDVTEARQEFDRLRHTLNPTCPLPMNKQKGEKRNHAYLTCIVNMLVEAAINRGACDYDPQNLTTITRERQPLRTLARRVDGAFPSAIDPVAIWEIKEYYYTKTFGSRVAGGVYETLLDGMEIEELEKMTGQRIDHVLFIDARYTWWECGRSYLCRMVDMLHMGYVDEVVFGKEVIARLPEMVADWMTKYRQRLDAVQLGNPA